MKASLTLYLAILFCSASLKADQTLSYPAKNPLVSFSAPDDWTSKVKNGSLFVVSPDGGDVIVEVMAMEAAIDDDAAALKEAKGTVDQDFKKLKLTKSDPTEANGLMVTLLGGEGEDESGPAHINMVLIKHPAATSQVLFSLIASKENAAKHGAACGAMMNSISAVASGKPKTKEPAAAAVQTFSYPSKAKPDFTVDFPADWKLEATTEGAYVESPDKLIPFNVIMIDAADAGVALESMKKKIGSAYSEIVWNDGKDPEVLKDDALGLTATFENGQAMDGKDPYVVNFVQYIKKGGDKFLLMFAQYPKAALSKHADNLEAVIKSIKVR